MIEEERQPALARDGMVLQIARGRYVPLGYDKDPEKTAASIHGVRRPPLGAPGDIANID